MTEIEEAVARLESGPQKCGVCGFPIHPSESGVRHFGFYIAHAEHRCVDLLRTALASEREARELAEIDAASWKAEAATEFLKRREAEKERDRFKPVPSAHEAMFSVVYRSGAPTVDDYDEAIEALEGARRALIDGDNMGCRVCEDSGHSASHCHHNPLLLARKWASASRFWQCWHCGFVATNDAEGREHFGSSDCEPPACLQSAEAALTAHKAEVVEALEAVMATRPHGYLTPPFVAARDLLAKLKPADAPSGVTETDTRRNT